MRAKSLEKAKELINSGYKSYRLIFKTNWNSEAKKQTNKILEQNKDVVLFKSGNFNSDESIFYVPFDFNDIYIAANFNVMVPGGTDVRFIKDNDFKTEFIFSL